MPRAHPHRVRPANPALLARPGTFPRSHSRLGRLPSRSRPSAAELALLPPLSTSCTPRGVAPPPSPSPPPQPPERVLPLLSPARRLGSQQLRRASGSRRPWPRRLRALSSARPPLLPPRAPLASSLPASGSRGPTPPPFRGPARSWRGLFPHPTPPNPTQATRALGPLLPARSLVRLARLALPGRPRSRALRGKRAPGRRAPGSGFSRLLSVR